MKKPIPFGKYLLLERVNVGGMAEVFKAKAFGVEGFERLVALKRILPSIAEDQEFITMFIDEAKISVQLTHANIASIFDLGKVADSYFIAMEFVRGKDMRAIFDRLGKRGQSVPVSMASYVVMKVCEGLDYAHNKRDSTGRELKLVHRDVSPQNILVSYDGEIKLIDFGIAKAANKAGKTQAGILKGKFGYMSPEQVRGLPLDRRSDVFAMGICLYELLTGERLFVGESDFSTLEKVRNVEIMPPSTYNRKIPEELEQIVLKALAKDVEDRYQTAMDLHDDLQSFMYTSGNFFARKDLGGHMRKMWSEEIQKEEIRDEQYRHVKAPPPIGSRPPPTPPPRSSRAPGMTKPPPPPPAALKRTLLGQGALAPPVSSAPASPAFDMDWDEDELATQIYDKPDELPGIPTAAPRSMDVPQTGPPPVASQPPTYAPNHGALASAQTAAPRPSFGSAAAAPAPFSGAAFPGASTGQPAPFDTPAQPSPFDTPNPQAAPSLAPREPTAVTHQPEAEKSKRGPLIIGVVLALLIILAAVIAVWPSSPGTIVLTASPPGAVVFFDDVPVQAQANGTFVIEDVTPDAVHLVSVRKTEFASSNDQVQVTSGELRTMTVRLEPDEAVPTETGFALRTTPPGATVFVDGRQLPGVTPLRVTDLSAGSHTIRAELAGRAAWQRAVDVAAGSVVDLDAPLGVAEIAARFRSEPSGAAVTLVRGEERLSLGRTPVEETVDVSGDRWTVEMTLRGHEEWSEPLRVPDGRTTLTINAELERTVRRPVGMGMATMYMRPDTVMDPVMVISMMNPVATGNGTVDINTRPWSEVYIDGRRVGNTPQRGLTLSAGRHRIRFVNPDFNISVTKTITVRAGQNQRVIETLSPN